MGSKNLAKAKNDEFYTPDITIEKETNAYIDYNPNFSIIPCTFCSVFLNLS